MTEDQAAVQQIRTSHPFPWCQMVFPNGEIKLFDSAGQEVGIFAITGLCTSLTAHMAVKTAA